MFAPLTVALSYLILANHVRNTLADSIDVFLTSPSNFKPFAGLQLDFSQNALLGGGEYIWRDFDIPCTADNTTFRLYLPPYHGVMSSRQYLSSQTSLVCKDQFQVTATGFIPKDNELTPLLQSQLTAAMQCTTDYLNELPNCPIAAIFSLAQGILFGVSLPLVIILLPGIIVWCAMHNIPQKIFCDAPKAVYHRYQLFQTERQQRIEQQEKESVEEGMKFLQGVELPSYGGV